LYDKNLETSVDIEFFKKLQIFYLGLHKKDVPVSRETFSHPRALQPWGGPFGLPGSGSMI
jgi:hypothetical protein